MDFALTTRWNAGRHTDGQAMIEEILALGFHRVELGYDTRLDLVPGIRAMVEQGAVQIDSVHNFCPLPMGAPRGHPELYVFASRDHRIREKAVQHTATTLRFACEMGARVVVSHAGNVEMRKGTMDLLTLADLGLQFTPRFEKARVRLMDRREKKAGKQMPLLLEALAALVPVIEETGVLLALEILPTWEAFPTEMEAQKIFEHFGRGPIKYWHDIGHAQIRENLGFINMERWLEKLEPALAGFHLHDVIPPGRDHVMPPHGKIDFRRYARFARDSVVRVIEPTPETPAEAIREGLGHLREAWDNQESAPKHALDGHVD